MRRRDDAGDRRGGRDRRGDASERSRGAEYRRPDEPAARDENEGRFEDSGPGRERREEQGSREPSGPELPEEVTADQLDEGVRGELVALARPVAEQVSRHLVMTGRLIDEEPELALEHALAARRLAARIAVVREAVGLAAYAAGDWASAITELRTYHRLTGSRAHLAVLADCERALGRPERAIDLYRGAENERLDQADAVELLIVAAGARSDLGQKDAAVAMLQVPELTADTADPWAARLRYAYADTLLAVGRTGEAREWFARAAEADDAQETDAAERLLELDGIVLDTPESAEVEEPAEVDPAGSAEPGSDDGKPDDAGPEVSGVDDAPVRDALPDRTGPGAVIDGEVAEGEHPAGPRSR